MSAVSALARPLAGRSAFRRGVPVMRTVARRFESTSPAAAVSSTAAKATEAAKETASRAAQGLSRVTSAAGPAIMGAARGVSGALGALGRIGGPVGRLFSFIERQVPAAIFYSRVGIELSQLVFKGQKMSPPSWASFQSYWQGVWKAVSNPSTLLHSVASSPAQLLNQVRNVSSVQLIAVGVLFAECLGFFTVGEMIGRFKVVGYHGENEHAHH